MSAKTFKRTTNFYIMKTITIKNYIKKATVVTFSLFTLAAFAQEEEESKGTLSISGSVDTYLRTTFNDAGEDVTATPTSFANQTGFALGMANVIASYEKGDAGVVVDLVYGPRGTEATFNNDVLNGIINQAYVYWNVSESTTLTIGRWNTFLGYEVIAPQANFNYSVSYLFSNGPFSHLGVKADFALSDDVSLMLALTNPWDTNDISTTGEYALGGQLGFYGQYLNLYYDSGKEGGLGFEIDYTGGFDLSDSFFLGINAAYNSNGETNTGFYGAALYPQVTLSDTFALGLRAELFQPTIDIDGVDDPESVTALTLTGSFTPQSNLIIKPEFRIDSSEGLFGTTANPTDSLTSFLLAAIYSFD